MFCYHFADLQGELKVLVENHRVAGRWKKWWDLNRDVFMLPGKPAEQAKVPVEGEGTVASSVI